MNLYLAISPLAAPDPLGAHECKTVAQSVANALRCHNLAGGNSRSATSSTTNTNDVKVGASDDSQANYGGTQATDNAQVGNFGSVVGREGSHINVTTADPEVLKRALAEYGAVATGFQKSLQDILESEAKQQDSVKELLGGQTQLSNSLFDTLSARIAELSESKQTEGLSLVTKIVMAAVIGLLLVGLVIA